MLLGITGFEIRYQLRNPVLLGCGRDLLPARLRPDGERERQHRHARRRARERAVTRSPSRPAILSLFYLFVVTAFVANAIVRDDTSGFAPIVRATSVTQPHIVLGRFLGGLVIAWLGYLAVPLGMCGGLDHAVGRSGDGRAAKLRLLRLAVR